MLIDPDINIFIAEEDGEALGYILRKLIERPENPFSYVIRYLLIDQISVRPAPRGAVLAQLSWRRLKNAR